MTDAPRPPVAATPRAPVAAVAAEPFTLVDRPTRLVDRVEVERRLPDIIGRALARIWIDPPFAQRFAADPVATLAAYGVWLPAGILVEFVTQGPKRPMVVIWEQSGISRTPRRLLYLQLVMVAGK